MSRRYVRFAPGIYITPTQKLWWRNTSGGAWSSSVISDWYGNRAGVLYPLGNDVANDIPYVLSEQLVADGFMGSVAFQWNPTSADYAKFGVTKNTGTTDVQLSARNPAGGTTDNSDNVWQMIFPALAQAGTWSLGVNGASLSVVSTYSARRYGFGMYPSRLLANDVTAQNYRASQSVADDGTVRTVFVGADAAYKVGLRLVDALPKGLVMNEYHQLEEFITYANQGAPVIIMPDATNFSPYSRAANPNGYVAGTLLRPTGDIEPKPENGNYYKNWRVDLDFAGMRVPLSP